ERYTFDRKRDGENLYTPPSADCENASILVHGEEIIMKKISRRSFLQAAGAAAAAMGLAACGGSGSSTAASGAAGSAGASLSGELVFTIWDNNLMNYIDENDMVGK